MRTSSDDDLTAGPEPEPEPPGQSGGHQLDRRGDGSWLLVYEGFDPARERLREALCTTANGRFGTRGAAPEARAGGPHYPGTYAAGVYNRLVTEIAGKAVEDESLVNLPNWLPLTFRIDRGPWFELGRVELLDYVQELDLRRGVLTRGLRFRDERDRCTRLVQRRLTSMADPHLAALQTTFTAENWSGCLEIRSGLDAGVENGGVKRYQEFARRHLEDAETAADERGIFLRTRTNQSRIELALAARTRILREEPLAIEPAVEEQRNQISARFEVELREGGSITAEKVVALLTSRDPAISEPGEAAWEGIKRAGTFEELHEAHAVAWDELWRRGRLELGGDGHSQLALNLHVFHLLQTISKHSIELDVGVLARGLHGEAYRGHVFWDELFVFPYLNLRFPELTRSLLRYRWRRLGAARRAAREEGLPGATYPWQSGSDGREESQKVHLNPNSGRWMLDSSHRQRHIDIAIALNILNYYETTADLVFLSDYGAEVLFEIARSLAARSSYDGERDRFLIRGVMGPDEFHDAYPGAERPGLDNNAYTNVMTAWTLSRALDVLERLPRERRQTLVERLRLERPELDLWASVSRRMFVPFHEDGTIISQFEGYGDLKELDWDGYRERYGDIQRLDRILEAEGDTPNRYKASKQADLVMLFFVLSAPELGEVFGRLGYPFDPEMIPRNIDYYARRTSHGSTLSRLVHSWVLARGDRERSWSLARETLESDLNDMQGGTTEEGIHLGAMAGTIDLIQRGYGGIEPGGDTLRLNPKLPAEIESLHFPLSYRGHRQLEVEINRERVRILAPEGLAPPVTVGFADRVTKELPAGGEVEFAID